MVEHYSYEQLEELLEAGDLIDRNLIDRSAILEDIEEETSLDEGDPTSDASGSPSAGSFQPVEIPSFFLQPSHDVPEHTAAWKSKMQKYQDICNQVIDDINLQVEEDLQFDDDSEDEPVVLMDGYDEESGEVDYEDDYPEAENSFEEISYYSDNEEEIDLQEDQNEESSSNSWMWGERSPAVATYQAQPVHSSGDKDSEQRTSPSTVEDSVCSGSNGDEVAKKKKRRKKGKKKKEKARTRMTIPQMEEKQNEDFEQMTNPWEQEVPEPRRLSGGNDSDSSSTRLRLRRVYASERSKNSSQRSKDRTVTSTTSTSTPLGYEVPWLREEQERLLVKPEKHAEMSDSSVETKCHGMCLRHTNGKWYMSLCWAVSGHVVWCLVVAFLLYTVSTNEAVDEGEDKSLRRPPSSTPNDAPLETPVPSVPALAPTAVPTTTLAPAEPPSDLMIPREPGPRCFHNRTELVLAVEGIFGPSQALVQEEYGMLSDWCVSKVTDFSELFAGRGRFNGNVSAWDTSSAVTMRGMFRDAVAFNQPLFWNTSSVVDMTAMFAGAETFDQHLDQWDVRSVQSMRGMFAGAVSFKGEIGTWDVSAVTDMSRMFSRAFGFDGDLTWNVSSVVDMTEMFHAAIRFQGNGLSTWNVTRVERLPRIFQTASSFSENLCTWGPLLLRDENATAWWNQTGSFANDAFTGTNCPVPADPNMDESPPGPFCFDCASVEQRRD